MHTEQRDYASCQILTQCCLQMIDEVHTLIGAGAAEGAIDAANILKPALARGELQCIGATTLDEYRKHIEKDPALERYAYLQMIYNPCEAPVFGSFTSAAPEFAFLDRAVQITFPNSIQPHAVPSGV